jgi:hypothetical protein
LLRKNSLYPIILSFVLTISAAAPLYAQTNESAGSDFSAVSYRVGERITYNVSYANFPVAAFVELLVAGRGNYAGREGIELRGRVETSGVVSAALFSINDTYVSFVDPATGIPFRSEVRSRSPNLSVNDDTARVASEGVSGAFDLLSALYRFRANTFTNNSRHRINVVYNGVQYTAEVRVRGRETVNTPVGAFNTILTEVRVPSNSRINDYRININFTEDERRIPVRLTARHRSGEVRAELASYDVTPPPADQTNIASGIPQTVTPNPAVQPTPARPAQPSVPRPTPMPDDENVNTSLPPDLPFQSGESLNYNVFIGNTAQSIGTISFQLRGRSRYFGRDGLLVTANARTTNAGARLFPVNDTVNSYVDPTTLFPFRTELNLAEGNRRVTQTITFDQDRATAVKSDGTRIDIQVGTHDLLSIFYALRSFNLTPPRRNAVTILAINRLRTLSINSLQRETIELGGQRVPAIQLSLTTDDSAPDRLGLRIWVSDDRRRLPLRMLITTPFGPVRADLAIIPVTRQ